MRLGTVYNILGVYSRGDHTDLSEGHAAYDMYHRTMRHFAEDYDVPVGMVAGIFAALSPMNDYRGNLRSMKTMLEARRHGRPISDVTVTTTHPNRDKAWRILQGAEPEDVLHSSKVRSFYSNIRWPGTSDEVTIDRHAMGIWFGVRQGDPRVPDYDVVARDYREAARILGIRPLQLQATTWFIWKRLNGIVYDPQMDLFWQVNQWKSIITPGEVKEFPWKSSTDHSSARSPEISRITGRKNKDDRGSALPGFVEIRSAGRASRRTGRRPTTSTAESASPAGKKSATRSGTSSVESATGRGSAATSSP